MKNQEEIINNMYDRLEKIRNEKGLSLTDFCSPLGKGQNWYQQSLKSKRDIGYSDLVRLLDFYGDLSFLLLPGNK